MSDRKCLVENSMHPIELIDNLKESLSYVIYPIIMNGDAVGLVLAISNNGDIGQLEEKLVNITAQFLGKHIEE